MGATWSGFYDGIKITKCSLYSIKGFTRLVSFYWKYYCLSCKYIYNLFINEKPQIKKTLKTFMPDVSTGRENRDARMKRMRAQKKASLKQFVKKFPKIKIIHKRPGWD